LVTQNNAAWATSAVFDLPGETPKGKKTRGAGSLRSGSKSLLQPNLNLADMALKLFSEGLALPCQHHQANPAVNGPKPTLLLPSLNPFPMTTWQTAPFHATLLITLASIISRSST